MHNAIAQVFFLEEFLDRRFYVCINLCEYQNSLKCPGLTCGINIDKPRFLFRTVDPIWSCFKVNSDNNHLCVDRLVAS